jgi:hypothetical protein
MLDVFNIAKPQNCNIQIFYGDGSDTNTRNRATWVKPRGVSHVYMLLIGAGNNGDGSTGGGSGAVTVFYVAAQNIPDSAAIWVGGPGETTYVTFVRTAGTDFISATAAPGTTGGAASTTGGYITAMGFYQSVAGQNGAGGAITASSTTFLSGGGGNTDPQASNYGYTTSRAANVGGFFMLQPIIVGAGGMGSGSGGIGCGGGVTGTGGPGMVLIASW